MEAQKHNHDSVVAAIRMDFGSLRNSIFQSSIRLSDQLQQKTAEELTSLVLIAYWDALQKVHGGNLSAPLQDSGDSPILVEEHLVDRLTDFGRRLATLPVEDAAYEVGQLYTHALPTALRATRGIYYTPPILVNKLLDQAEQAGIDWTSARVLDPSSGGGAFLVAATIRMINALTNTTPEIALRNVESRIEGWELESFAARLSAFFISAAVSRLSAETGYIVQPKIRSMDSLRCEQVEFGRFDLVVGNPPFGKQRLDPDLRTRYKASLFGHANLYGLFTELAVRLTKDNGVISLLTPASFLAGEYFKNLRSVLWHESPPFTLAFVASRKNIFDGVLQETVLASYKKGEKQYDASTSVIHLNNAGVRLEDSGVFKLPKDSQSPWMVARRSDDETLLKNMRTMSTRLNDWGYKISTGPLVWNRHKDQLRTRYSKSTSPIVWSESVTSTGEFILRYEKKNHDPFLHMRGDIDQWLVSERPCVLLQRTTAKEQKRRLIAAVLPISLFDKYGSVVVENHLNMIYPVIRRPAVSLDVLSAFLNSEASDRAFRCLSGSVAVSAYELESLPIPCNKTLAKLKRLVKSDASKELIDAECWSLYGIVR